MEKIKVFISQPMRNKTREQIEADRSKIITIVEKKFGKDRVEILDTIFPDFENLKVKNKSVFCLGWALQKLAEADYFVCFLDEMIEGYLGCQIEKQVAKSYKIPTLVLQPN